LDSSLVKRILSSLKCDKCGQAYDSHNVKVIGKQQDLWLLTAYCETCDIQYLIVAAIKDEKSVRISDLSKAEVSRFRRKTVDADDVLDMHRYLRRFNGDFSRLFVKK
jgi:hypothetical protein